MPNTLTEWLACWFLISVIAAPFIGSLLHKRRVRLNRQKNSAECLKLEALCNLADEFEAAPTDAERQRIYIKAEALGLCDPPEHMRWHSFPDDSRPFMLDENEQPHLPKAS